MLITVGFFFLAKIDTIYTWPYVYAQWHEQNKPLIVAVNTIETTLDMLFIIIEKTLKTLKYRAGEIVKLVKRITAGPLKLRS